MPFRRGGNGSGMDGSVDCGDSGVGSGRIWASVFIYDRFFGDETGKQESGWGAIILGLKSLKRFKEV